MILFLFFCSGATALVYEVLWSKYLGLMFGSTVQAQTAVLSVFMGGLALGNAIFGRMSRALKNPLLAYGYMELAIALYAFAFDWIYRGADRIFVGVGSGLLEQSAVLLVLKGALSVMLLGVPTVLMGGTLPMLVTWLQRNATESGRLSARFYSINSLGAVFGSALAGFYLVKTLGLISTAQITALANALIGAAAIGFARKELREEASSPAPSGETEDTRGALGFAAVLVAITGGVSMGLEILASRALALIFGSSLQAFALVLIAFILGIGLGSAAIASPRFKRWTYQGVVTVLLLTAAVWIGLAVFRIESWVEFYRWSKTGLSRSEVGYFYHQALSGFMALVVLGIPAALIGAVLPLMIRLLSQTSQTLGADVGRLLTCNTLGAVGGVLITGFWLMPELGLRSAFITMAACLGATALFHNLLQKQFRTAFASAFCTIAIASVFVFGNADWKTVLSSGAFRSRDTVYNPDAMKARREAIKIIYYKDAADATISVEEARRTGQIFLRINGKTDASSRGDYSTQVLLGHLPMMARPDSKDVFVLGLGSGVTAGSLLGHPIEHLTVAENCEPVIHAANFFAKWNNGVLTDKRTHIAREDGRTVLKLSPRQYDLIISEPSNPWTAGVGSVFSREFYEIAAGRLKPGGLMAQWFHVYEMHDGIVSMVIRTFGSVFPHLEIWETAYGDIVLLGSKEPWSENFDNCRRIFEREVPREQLKDIGLTTPEQILARQIASQQTAFAIAGEGSIQSDFIPILEYEAPKAFYMGLQSSLLQSFDERTVQTALLPEVKKQALSVMDDQKLRPIFQEFGSLNPDLMAALRGRLKTNTAPVAVEIATIFTPAAPPATTNTNQLAILVARLKSAENQAQTLSEIELQLSASHDQGEVAFYATAVARHCIGQGDVARADRIIATGLQADPTDAQLNYLSRVMQRRQSRLASARQSSPIPH